MRRSLSLAFVLFLAGPTKANPVDPVTSQSSLGAGSLDAPDTFGRQHGDIDDSQAIVAETADKLEMEHIVSNSKVDLLEKELSAIPSLTKLVYEAMKELEDSVKQVQKTADDNSEKLKTNKDAVQKNKDAMVHNIEVINKNQKELEDSVKQVQKTAEDNFEKLKTNKGQIESNWRTCDTKIQKLETGHTALIKQLDTKTQGQLISNQRKIRTLETKTTVLETSVAFCGYTYHVPTTGVITYSKLYTSHSSDGSALDMNTGKYRARTSGIYQLSWGGVSSGGYTMIFIYQGDTRIGESGLQSLQYGDDEDMATKTTAICITAGNVVFLKKTQMNGKIYNFNFCLTLLTSGPC